nr:hypothetical protein Iba_chr08eCG4770 [Ipomoea batatas]
MSQFDAKKQASKLTYVTKAPHFCPVRVKTGLSSEKSSDHRLLLPPTSPFMRSLEIGIELELITTVRLDRSNGS